MKSNALIQKILLLILTGAVLFLSLLIAKGGHPYLGTGVMIISLGSLYIFTAPKAYTYRYLYPSLMAFALFVITPLLYTVYISFTNYSDKHRQTEPAVCDYFLQQKTVNSDYTYSSKIFKDGSTYQIVLVGPDISSLNTSPSSSNDTISDSISHEVKPKEVTYVTEQFSLNKLSKKDPIHITPNVTKAQGTMVSMKDLIAIKDKFNELEIQLTPSVGLTMDGLSRFSAISYNWTLNTDNTLTEVATGTTISSDKKVGYFVDQSGKRYGPGFKTTVGFAQFKRIFTDPVIQKPFVKIFIWTVSFAIITTVLIFFLGFILSVILQWPGLKGRAIWRTLLILPYAVPAFISILVFKGLFNPQFGEINAMLMALFGISPEWTTDPMMAKTMVLLVNLWLGYPYMMILTMGLLQSISTDIYEASAIDGGNPINDTFRLTLPLILKPMKPLLITTFAFNFNNFLLINLLTNGAPQMKGVSGVVGDTDLLVTYTYNLAFMSGNNYALASAISVIIFIIVGILAYLNLKVTMKEGL